MLELVIKIEASEIAGAINNLANAIKTPAISAMPKAEELAFKPEDVEKVEKPKASKSRSKKAEPKTPVEEVKVEEPVSAPEEVKAEDPTPEKPKVEEPVAETMPEPEVAPVEEITYEKLFTRCQKAIQGKTLQPNAMMQVLSSFKVTGLPQLTGEQYKAVWEELDKMGVPVYE